MSVVIMDLFILGIEYLMKLVVNFIIEILSLCPPLFRMTIFSYLKKSIILHVLLTDIVKRFGLCPHKEELSG